MLAQAAERLKLKVKVISEADRVPAKLAPCELIRGAVSDPTALGKFSQQLSLMTIENEFLPIAPISELANAIDIKIFPTLDVIKITQNKLNQKFLFKKLNIPTAPFVPFDPLLDKLDDWLKQITKSFSKGCMLKWGLGGYDGKGNFILNNEEGLSKAKAFCESALRSKTTIYAEELINFKKELAMVYVSGLNGEFMFYPLVISEQEHNICRTVFGPAVDFLETEFGIKKELELKAAEFGKQIANELQFVGTFAFEFFLTQNNEIIVNEMAPRVHNSGHYTQDTYHADQFENHLRAITGQKLVPPNEKKLFMMRNLLAPENSHLSLPNRDLSQEFGLDDTSLKVHWYGKSTSSPYRKMGHINTLLNSQSEVESKKKALMDAERKIWQTLNKKFGHLDG